MRVRLVMRSRPSIVGEASAASAFANPIGVHLTDDEQTEIFVPWSSIDFVIKDPKPTDEEPF